MSEIRDDERKDNGLGRGRKARGPRGDEQGPARVGIRLGVRLGTQDEPRPRQAAHGERDPHEEKTAQNDVDEATHPSRLEGRFARTTRVRS